MHAIYLACQDRIPRENAKPSLPEVELSIKVVDVVAFSVEDGQIQRSACS